MKIQQSVFTTLLLAGRHSDRELLFAAIEKFKKDHHGEFTSAGSYARKIYSPENHAHDDGSTDIILPRIRPHAGSGEAPASHALSSDVLIPGSSYTIRFVLTVLHAYLHRDCTVDELCARFFISHSTLYDWKRLFEAHAASWDRSLKASTKLCDDLLSSMQSIPALPFRFLSRFAVSFLQSRCRSFSILGPAPLPPPAAAP